MRIDFQTYLPDTFDGRSFGPDELRALAAEGSVERCVVMPSAQPQPDNAALARRIDAQPEMIGCAALNPARGSEVVDELEQAVHEWGFMGLRLYPATHGYDLDSSDVDLLLAKALNLQLPVTVDGCREHCSPAQVSELASRFPDVPFIVDVGFRPSAPPVSMKIPLPPEGRIAEVAESVPNVYLGLTTVASVELYCIKRLMGVCGPQKLIFGSNAPHGIPQFGVRGFQMGNLPPEEEEAILGGTLARLYRLGGEER